MHRNIFSRGLPILLKELTFNFKWFSIHPLLQTCQKQLFMLLSQIDCMCNKLVLQEFKINIM